MASFLAQLTLFVTEKAGGRKLEMGGGVRRMRLLNDVMFLCIGLHPQSGEDGKSRSLGSIHHICDTV